MYTGGCDSMKKTANLYDDGQDLENLYPCEPGVFSGPSGLYRWEHVGLVCNWTKALDPSAWWDTDRSVSPFM